MCSKLFDEMGKYRTKGKMFLSMDMILAEVGGIVLV